MTSFRRRIQWFTISLIAGLLAIFSLALYLGLSYILSRHIDEQLLAVASAEAQQVEKETGELNEMGYLSSASAREFHDAFEAEWGREEHELLEAIRHSVVFDRDGQILWKGEGVAFRAELPPETQVHVLKGEPAFDTLYKGHAPVMRRISFPIPLQGEIRYVLQTQMSLKVVRKTLQWLLVACGTGSLVVLTLAWVGSTWIARVALSPVSTLSRTAAHISDRSLETRVALDAPYEEFQQLAQSFNHMLDRLHKVFESQRRFVADAAHELKTPLTAMKGNLEVALQRARSVEEYRDVIAANLSQVEHMSHLTRSLLTLAQFAGSRPPVQLEPMTLKPILEELTAEITVLAKEQGCRLIVHVQDDPVIVGDTAQLKRVFINLLDNALRHTPRGGTITVAVEVVGDEVLASVTDTGCGIAAIHLPHIFERFYRVDEARNRHEGGTGLGLAIAHEIALAHGGALLAQSEVGKGSIFILKLPVRRTHHSP